MTKILSISRFQLVCGTAPAPLSCPCSASTKPSASSRRGHGQRGSAHRRAHPGADQVKINGDINYILIIYTRETAQLYSHQSGRSSATARCSPSPTACTRSWTATASSFSLTARWQSLVVPTSCFARGEKTLPSRFSLKVLLATGCWQSWLPRQEKQVRRGCWRLRGQLTSGGQFLLD